MKRSTKRILTTHVGSLPRPADLLEMNDAKVSGRPVDQAVWTAACPLYEIGASQMTSVHLEPFTVLKGWILSYSS